MSRSGFLAVAVFFLVAAVLVARYVTLSSDKNELDALPLVTTGGRVQLVLDEQDVGLVQQGMTLAVTFTVANSGSEPLVLRQSQPEYSQRLLPTLTIEPGRTGEVTAELLSDELLGRGRKHVRFSTSDPASPELWLTVRGTVLRRETASEDDGVERSVLVK